ncbi:MAG: TonB-dependent receptor [Gemmatimonadales bacterium]|nr:TonB-dependent receptor [Gemmatimonadales bacterium]
MVGLTAFFAGLVLAGPVRIQPPPVEAPDTLRPARLAPVEVQVTRTSERSLHVPATVFVVDSATLRSAQLQHGLDEVLGRVPGVYVANRFNPSLDQRLAIRGAGARANFGVRGVKVLLDGMPLTLPDGQTQLSNLDLGLVDRIEVLLGAASAMYGNAGGGVVAFESALPTERWSGRVRAGGGSFGTSRIAGQLAGSADAWSGSAALSRYASSGVRQQSTSSATQLTLTGNRVLDARWLLKARYYYADSPEAQNPGALTLAELRANRDSAAGNNILRGADKAVRQHQAGIILTHDNGRGRRADLTVFGLTRDLDNPLATAPPGPAGPTVGTFSAIDRVAGGIRLSGQQAIDQRGTRLGFGIDLQSMRDDRTNRRSRGGAPTDTIVADQRETATEFGPYLLLHLEPAAGLTVSTATRYDRVAFRVADRHLADGVDQSGRNVMGAFSGSVGASYALSAGLVGYATVASAFETPTTTELVNQANGTIGFNRDLGPQRTLSTEAGLRTSGTIAAHLAVYRSAVRDALVQAREQDGRAYFENAARLTIRGLEIGAAWQPAPWLAAQLSYSHTDARFSRYLLRDGATQVSLDGNLVPGIPRHLFRGVLTANAGPLLVEWDQQLTSQIYADDRNTLAADGWGLGITSIRLRAAAGAGGGLGMAPFVGVSNLWNRRYVASVTVNGFGGRVYEPAPGRWFYAGLEASLRPR